MKQELKKVGGYPLSSISSKVLRGIKDEDKKSEYTKTFEENKIKDSDSLDDIDKKIEELEKLFRFVKHQWESELARSRR